MKSRKTRRSSIFTLNPSPFTFHLSLFTFHLSLFTLFAPSLGAQTIYEPLDSPIYNYLDRVEARYGYALLNFTRPVARMEIARVLDSLSRSDAMLASFDREELAWYRAEFAEEIGRLVREGTASAVPADERWNLVRVRGEKPVDGFLSADIVAGGGYTIRADAENVFRRSIGINAMGYASEYIGASLRWYDNGRRGIPYDVYSRRVPEQGIVKGPSKEIDNYDWEVAEAQFTFSLPWLRIGVVKTDMSWGSGREGQIVLSSKAPSFPVINLQIAITDWLRLDYMHGWLFSDTLEVSVGFTAPGATESLKFYENKFYAAHAVTARITPALQLSLGESIVYSGGSVSPLFVIPVMPFRAADRWTRAATGNSQIFADVRYRVLPGVTVYGTGYIDELDYGKILASDKTAFDYHIAYTIGAMATDLHWKLLPLPSESSLEFSRLYPYVYTNPKPVQRYTSHSVMLGHWIGANADILTARHTVHPARGWDISAALSYARFGQSDMFLDRGERIQPAFLYGWEYSRMTVSGSVAYRPIHGLTVRAFAEYVKNTQGDGYTGSPVPEGTSIGGSVGYGLP